MRRGASRRAAARFAPFWGRAGPAEGTGVLCPAFSSFFTRWRRKGPPHKASDIKRALLLQGPGYSRQASGADCGASFAPFEEEGKDAVGTGSGGTSVCTGVGSGVGAGVGAGVAVGTGACVGVGAGVCVASGVAVGFSVGVTVGDGVGLGVAVACTEEDSGAGVALGTKNSSGVAMCVGTLFSAGRVSSVSWACMRI